MKSRFPQAKKRFGQHFLNNQNIIERIVRSINPKNTDSMIEIGPGPDVLTPYLVAAVKELHLIEIDRDLAATLIEHYSTNDHVHIHNTDVLTIDWASFDGTHPWRVVGNLPYNISTPLIFSLLQANLPISDMTFLLQQEVVDRLCAQPGSKQYGRLSVMAQYYCKTQRLFTVPASAFTPPPKVTSAVVSLTPHINPNITATDLEHFAGLVKQAFSQRRKTISNSLKDWSKKDQISESGIDPSARAETITVEKYITLSNLCVENKQKKNFN